ncbi:MAG: hypothetical protein IJN53_00725 [Oscillospiraceae bacterium]|nr:hypothetical protein [Oscillospiraceae bacterium]
MSSLLIKPSNISIPPSLSCLIPSTAFGIRSGFCLERYLTDPDTDVYKAFATLKAGDVVDIEGFIYWYNGVNTHITAVAPVK